MHWDWARISRMLTCFFSWTLDFPSPSYSSSFPRPVGWLQNTLEFLHIGVGLPWWGSIMAATVVARLCLFPLVVYSMQNATRLANIKPEMDQLTAKMNEAFKTGDTASAATYSNELKQVAFIISTYLLISHVPTQLPFSALSGSQLQSLPRTTDSPRAGAHFRLLLLWHSQDGRVPTGFYAKRWDSVVY